MCLHFACKGYCGSALAIVWAMAAAWPLLPNISWLPWDVLLSRSQRSFVFWDEFAHCQLENQDGERFMYLWLRVRNKQSL